MNCPNHGTSRPHWHSRPLWPCQPHQSQIPADLDISRKTLGWLWDDSELPNFKPTAASVGLKYIPSDHILNLKFFLFVFRRWSDGILSHPHAWNCLYWIYGCANDYDRRWSICFFHCRFWIICHFQRGFLSAHHSRHFYDPSVLYFNRGRHLLSSIDFLYSNGTFQCRCGSRFAILWEQFMDPIQMGYITT